MCEAQHEPQFGRRKSIFLKLIFCAALKLVLRMPLHNLSLSLQCHFKLSSLSCGTKNLQNAFPAFLHHSLFQPKTTPEKIISQRSFLRHDPRQMNALNLVFVFGESQRKSDRSRVKIFKRISSKSYKTASFGCVSESLIVLAVHPCVGNKHTLDSFECVREPIFSIFSSFTNFSFRNFP